MRLRRFEWEGAADSAAAIRGWAAQAAPRVDVDPIRREVREGGDEAVVRLTARFDATESPPESLRVDPDASAAALAGLDRGLRESLELAVANIRLVAEAQVDSEPCRVELPQGQLVTIREVPVRAAGLYAPGGRAAYPSSVLMTAVPARVAGVERLALASPPRPDGQLDPVVLAAAELAGVDEIYAMGGAQAIFALAHGTETIAPVDVIAGPGSLWVVEAKRAVCGEVGIDSLAGPSELMAVLDDGTDPDWAALDLCAQAEHGGDGMLVAVAAQEETLSRLGSTVERAADTRPGVGDAPLALLQAPDLGAAIDLANALAPEHLELLVEDAEAIAPGATTAGCVFVGPRSATAFGDYAAGTNHVLPTGGSGRFSGPLGPATFRRRIAALEVSPEAADELAPHVEAIASAEGFPVHGESAMIRRS